MKIGDLVKFKEGHGWETVGIVIGTCHVDMIRVLWAIPCDPEFSRGWHSLDYLEAV